MNRVFVIVLKIKRKLTMKKYICLALFMLPFSLLAQTMLQGKISLKDATDTFAEACLLITSTHSSTAY